MNHIPMRLRTCLIISAGLNLALATGWIIARKPTAVSPVGVSSTNAGSAPARVRTSVVVRSQNFTWQEVESADYVTYINNLRMIGCPEQTIRDIIVADVNQLYARRRATEVVSSDHQWWRSDPDTDLLKAALEKMQALNAERKTLLTKLLGPNWEAESGALPAAARIALSLTGPVLGDLSPETKQRVYNIAVQTQEKIDAYQEIQRQQNKPVDPLELARIRDSSRAELSGFLKPEEMEELLLRYSKTAQDLRQEMRGLNATAEEFRAMFRARDGTESQSDIHYTGDDPEAIKRRQALEKKREDAMKTALGPERYAIYHMNQDPVFRDAKITTEDLGVPVEKVMPIYEINRLTQSESDLIRNDESLTNEEKVEALAATQVEQQKALEKILGAEAFQRWLQGKKR